MRCGRKVIGREVRSEARGLVLLLGQEAGAGWPAVAMLGRPEVG